MKTFKAIRISAIFGILLFSNQIFAANTDANANANINTQPPPPSNTSSADKSTKDFIDKLKKDDVDNKINASFKKQNQQNQKKEAENNASEVKVNSPIYWNLGLGFDADFLYVQGHRPASDDFFGSTFITLPGFSISLGAGNVIFSFKEWVLTVETVLMFNDTTSEKDPSPFTDNTDSTNPVRDLFERSPFTADALVGFLSPPFIANKYSIKGFFGTSITQFSYSVASTSFDNSAPPMSNGDVYGSGVGIGFKLGAGLLFPFSDMFAGGDMFSALGTCDLTYFPPAQISINTTFRRLQGNLGLHCGVAVQFGGTIIKNNDKHRD